jgi:glycosyltransferase involved in cell wall biosynthesis
MRVAIDVTAGINQGAGVGRATRETVTALAALGGDLRLHLFYGAERTATAAAGEHWLAGLRTRYPAVTTRRLALPPRWLTRLWLRLRVPVPVEVVTGPVDILLAPDFVAPPAARARPVVTVHDVSYLTVPQYADPGLRRYLTAAVPRSLRHAAHVVAVSEATRHDIIRYLGLPTERVSVVYNGVDQAFRPLDAAETSAVRARLDLPPRFVLIVGTLEPRKNHAGLIRAFAHLSAEDPALGLVVSGRRGWLEEPIFAHVRRLGLEERVRFLGPVPDVDLPALYNLATVFAFPSWYEGFGLPPLEAMACGTPVVTSTGGALPEVCGPAALIVEPGDEAGLATALRRLLHDDSLRASLRQRGLEQAARFTWEATARQLFEVLQRVR